jgi:hypothetical protein
MFCVHRCLTVMMCRDLEWDVLQSTEAVGLLLRMWAQAVREVLRNGSVPWYERVMSLVSRDFHLFGAVIISDQVCALVPHRQETCKSARSENAKRDSKIY